MARKPRFHYSGAFYHVILSGNGGQDNFSVKMTAQNSIYFFRKA
jgi:hypothetical protein